MRKKLLSFFLTIACMFNSLSFTVYAEGQELITPIMFTFTGYEGFYDQAVLPDGFSVQREMRRVRTGAAWFDSSEYNEVLKLGYFAESNLAFGRLVDSGKMHIGFNFSVSDKIARRMFVGFYDGRNNSDPYSWGNNDYSLSVVLGMGKVGYCRSQYSSERDMTSWRVVDSPYTYESNEWHRIDLLFDLDNQIANYYFDGNQINSQPIGTNSTQGFKSLFFRVDSPGTTNVSDEENEYYKTTADVFYIDNLYVNMYTGNDNLFIETVQKEISPVHGEVSVVLSEQADISRENVRVVNVQTGEEVEFSGFETTSNGFKLTFSRLAELADYSISLNGVYGKLTGELCVNSATFSTGNNPYYLLYRENFENITSDNLSSKWQSEQMDKVSIADGREGNGLKISSSTTEDFVTQTLFDSPITSDKFILEMYVKYNGGFDVGFIKQDNTLQKVAGVTNNDPVVGFYQTNSSTIVKPNTACRFLAYSNRWNKLKITVDKVNQSYTITTGAGSYTVEYSYHLGDIYGIGFISHKSSGKNLLVDDIFIGMSNSEDFMFKVSFRNRYEDNSGVNISTGGFKEDFALKLQCTEEFKDENNVTNYRITPSNGTIIFDVDGDCDDVQTNENIVIDVEYLDVGYGWFFIKYAGVNGTTSTESVCLLNTEKTLTYSFVISDALLNNSLNNNDFQLCTTTMTSNSTVANNNRTFSRFPVYIKSIKGYKDGSYSFIKISASSEFAGNIFYDFDVPKFNVKFNNTDTENHSFHAKYTIYQYDKEMNPILIDEQSSSYTVQAGGSTEDNIVVPVSDYGLYNIKVSVMSDQGIKIANDFEIPFSRCVKNDHVSYTIGASTHFTRYGNADIGIGLMKNAGMGLVRDDFEWSKYEQQLGVRQLTPTQTLLLEAVKKHNVKLLPIVTGNNSKYDSSGSSFVKKENLIHFGNFVTSLLSEPLFHENVTMIEVWNEPDIVKTLDGQYIYNDNQTKGAAYADILKTAYEAAKSVDPNYQVGGFSICNISGNNAKEFTDIVLSNLNGYKAFDTVTMHPYLAGHDPEIGHFGEDSTNPNTYIGYVINYYRSLLNGTPLFNHITGENETVRGIATNNTYNYNWNEPIWHTEFGYSSAKYDKDRLCLGSEYEQAKFLIRGLNQIRINNLNDKIWIYDIADDGLRINEKEHNFGLLHAWEYKVPYAAKYAFLAVSNMNKMIYGATEANIVYSQDYNFVAEYKTPERNVYLLWTTKDTGSVRYNLGSNVWYYDLLGNRLDESEVMKDGEYILTSEPFYAVTGKDIERTHVITNEKPVGNKSSVELFILNGFSDFSSLPLDRIPYGRYGVMLVFKNMKEQIDYRLFCAEYLGDELVSVQIFNDITQDSHLQYKKYDLFFHQKDQPVDKIKFILWNNQSEMIPICEAFEKR
mgnify:CR=1 FL=1